MTKPCVICRTYDGVHKEMPTQIALHSTPNGSVCSVCIKKMVAQWNDRDRLLYDSMMCLDNDFVPGPKHAKLWQRYYELTGILEGDEYVQALP